MPNSETKKGPSAAEHGWHTSVENPPLTEKKFEPEKEESSQLDIPFYVTDHSPRHADTGSPEQLRRLYSDIKNNGINSVRYDWDWNLIEPQIGKFDGSHLDRYQQGKEIMGQVGLEPPTIVLSNIPKWAQEFYHKNKEAFFNAFTAYVEQVKQRLELSGGKKVERIQVLNEFNNKIYNPIAIEDLPRLADITRQVLQDYNPDIKLMGTMIAGNTNDLAARFGQGTGIKDYLQKFKDIMDKFDVIAIDYYPGLWHQPLSKLSVKMLYSKAGRQEYKDEVVEFYKNMDLLEDTFRELATWGKEYELGEVGLPTNKLFGDEKNQRYFYDVFFRSLKHMLLKFQAEHVKLPSRIGLYEAIDEAPRDRVSKSKLISSRHPEFSLGMRKENMEPKMILQGNRHREQTADEPSQLNNIIRYFHAPMKRDSNQKL